MDTHGLIAIPQGIALFGGVAVAVGVVLAVRERRRRGAVWRTSLVGLVAFTLVLLFAVLDTAQGCGPDCVVDPTPLISLAFWNLVVWQLAVLVVWSWTRPSRSESASQDERDTT